MDKKLHATDNCSLMGVGMVGDITGTSVNISTTGRMVGSIEGVLVVITGDIVGNSVTVRVGVLVGGDRTRGAVVFVVEVMDEEGLLVISLMIAGGDAGSLLLLFDTLFSKE